MNIILSDGQVIEILNINVAGKTFDWKRTDGYTGACLSSVEFELLEEAEAAMKAVLEAELVREG